MNFSTYPNFKYYNPDYPYESRHGSAFNRGCSDFYYGRGISPHYYTGRSYFSEKIVPAADSPEFFEYMSGYEYAEFMDFRKDYGED